MGVLTLLGFLVGDRQSILAVAGNRHALWVGLVFVLSAGFAREYDGEDLMAQPWHLLLPPGASLLTSLFLFALVTTNPSSESPVSKGYLSFLGTFWMTAPLAWLYAIPYERFLDPATAADANLVTLGVVAVWRVVLITRVIHVCTRISVIGSAAPVALVSSALVIVAAVVYVYTRLSALDVMGGIREPVPSWHHRSGNAILALEPLALPVGLVSFYVWAVGPPHSGWSPTIETGPVAPSIGLIALAATSLLVWVLVLPYTQAEQQMRTRIERAIAEGRYDEAAALLDNPRTVFPPHFVPPPTQVTDATIPRLLAMLLVSSKRPLPDWVAEAYHARLHWVIGHRSLTHDKDLCDAVVAILPKLPGHEKLLVVPKELDPLSHDYDRQENVILLRKRLGIDR